MSRSNHEYNSIRGLFFYINHGVKGEAEDLLEGERRETEKRVETTKHLEDIIGSGRDEHQPILESAGGTVSTGREA